MRQPHRLPGVFAQIACRLLPRAMLAEVAVYVHSTHPKLACERPGASPDLTPPGDWHAGISPRTARAAPTPWACPCPGPPQGSNQVSSADPSP